MAVKIIFACPSYGLMDPDVAMGQRVNISQATKIDGVPVEWVGDVSVNDVKLSTIDSTRNRMIDRVLETDADAIFWCDSDIILPPMAIAKLVAHGKDFVTGIYCQRYPPYYPVVTHYDPDGGGSGKPGMNWMVGFPDDMFAPAGGCGFGCVLTSTEMLRAMPRPWFSFGDFSEDFTFCVRAREAGFQLYVDTGVQCTHLGLPERITVETFRSRWVLEKGDLQAVRPHDSAA